MKSKKIRNSNFELLRIISMFMIVFIHANMYLGWFASGSFRIFANGAVNGICNIGVTCFVLISGYHGLRFNLRKLVTMECMMISWSLVETAVLFLIFPEQMQGAALLEACIKSLFPVISRKYWFYSCYVCLSLLSGFLHILIENLKKEEFQKLLFILLLCFSVFPTFFYFEIMQDNGKGLIQMIMIYLIGRYINIYGLSFFEKKKAIIIFFCLWIINGVSHEIPIKIGGIYHHLCKDNSITNIIMAVILFCLFKEMKLQVKFINKAAANIFTVFALNNSLVTIIMSLIERNNFQKVMMKTGFLSLAGIVLGVLMLCLFLGEIRARIFGRSDEWIANKAEKIGSKINKRILKGSC